MSKWLLLLLALAIACGCGQRQSVDGVWTAKIDKSLEILDLGSDGRYLWTTSTSEFPAISATEGGRYKLRGAKLEMTDTWITVNAKDIVHVPGTQAIPFTVSANTLSLRRAAPGTISTAFTRFKG